MSTHFLISVTRELPRGDAAQALSLTPIVWLYLGTRDNLREPELDGCFYEAISAIRICSVPEGPGRPGPQSGGLVRQGGDVPVPWIQPSPLGTPLLLWLGHKEAPDVPVLVQGVQR